MSNKIKSIVWESINGHGRPVVAVVELSHVFLVTDGGSRTSAEDFFDEIDSRLARLEEQVTELSHVIEAKKGNGDP